MAQLEELTVGASVIGLTGNAPVSIVAVKWYGNAVLEITYKDARGQLASQLLYREDEEKLEVGGNALPWSFDADANLLRLASEAYRINLAHIFDPYLAVHTSAIEPLPHQISAVYKEAYIQPIIEGKTIRYEVKYGKNTPEPPKTGRGQFKCVCCGEAVKSEYIHTEFQAKQSGAQLMAIVAEGNGGRLYFSPQNEHISVADCPPPSWTPEAEMNTKSTDLISGRGYGFSQWHELFTNRQLTALTTFCDLVTEAQKQMLNDGASKDYIEAVGAYLGIGIDRNADINNSLCRWKVSATQTIGMFARQAIPMVWDYAENNVFNNAAGDYTVGLNSIAKVLERLEHGL